MQQFRMQSEEEGNATPHYDSETVRQVLARASQIEQEKEQVALTPEQIEALGQELGLSVDSVRRALGEVAPAGLHQTRKAAAFTLRDVWLASRFGALYGTTLFVASFIHAFGQDTYSIAFSQSQVHTILGLAALLLPPILSAIPVRNCTDWRLGIISGGVLSSMALYGYIWGIGLATGDFRGWGYPDMPLVQASFILSLALGAFSGWLGKQKEIELLRKAR